jgi:hypothetical protein
MNLQDDEVMFEIRTVNGNLPTFAWNSAESFAFFHQCATVCQQLDLNVVENWELKLFQCVEMVSDSEKVTICSWKWSICCFWLPCFEVLPHRIVRDTVLWCKERHEHAPKVESLGSETVFKEESWFLIAATCWPLAIDTGTEMMNVSFIRAVWHCRLIGLAHAVMQQYKSSFPFSVYEEVGT